MGDPVARRVVAHIGQVVDEDDEFITLKVGKSDLASYKTDEGRFVTLAFLAADDDGNEILPWDTDPV